MPKSNRSWAAPQTSERPKARVRCSGCPSGLASAAKTRETRGPSGRGRARPWEVTWRRAEAALCGARACQPDKFALAFS